MARVEKSIEVQAPVEAVYRVWSNFESFPEFMENVQEVRMTGGGSSHWKVKGPVGTNVEWDAMTTESVPNQRISWQSTGGEVETYGSVTFSQVAPDVTRLNVIMEYKPPAGAAGEAVARIFSDPERQVEEDLQRFKALVERRGGAA
ncbi:MAG TPA: SRPBCC family protein [Dehalococcoidia bacterium]